MVGICSISSSYGDCSHPDQENMNILLIPNRNINVIPDDLITEPSKLPERHSAASSTYTQARSVPFRRHRSTFPANTRDSMPSFDIPTIHYFHLAANAAKTLCARSSICDSLIWRGYNVVPMEGITSQPSPH